MINSFGLTIKSANLLYKNGNYLEALKSYLQLSLDNQFLSFAIRANIEICIRKLAANRELNICADHPRYFRYGNGHSSEFGATFFDNPLNTKRINLISRFEPDELKRGTRLKFVFVADSNPASNRNRKVWGAETSAEFVANYGRQLGHDVSTVDPYNFDQDAILSADLLILRSIERFDDKHLAFLKSMLFEKLKPYVTYQHDYAFCKFRNSIKCMGKLDQKTCTECLTSNNKYFGGQIAFYTKLLNDAVLNIFISHPQRHVFGEVLGSSIDPSIVILPPVDPDLFKPIDIPRNPKLIVNTSGKLNNPNKGFSNIAQYIDSNPNYTYELYTEKSQELIQFASTRKNVNLIDPVDNSTLPEIYSRAGHLLVMPSIMEPAGRTPIEAALCGCQVITNNKLGVGYFNLPMHRPDQLRALILKSLDTLWYSLACIVRKKP